ncbi:RNA-binding protein 27 [Crotalus adamanteus]|uniref:RNA-binding protein 27 n=1 Tax=Crotalus adamanteus TaxID=8729 RepID=A0AAW1BWM4_CROAD
MIIENVDALKSWLAKLLEPICDADPSALANYVVALVKKDKPEKELKAFCADQLDVFLQKETSGFVDKLFESLYTKNYLVPNEPVKPDLKTNQGKEEIKEEAMMLTTVLKNVIPISETFQESFEEERENKKKKYTSPQKNRSDSNEQRTRERKRDDGKWRDYDRYYDRNDLYRDKYDWRRGRSKSRSKSRGLSRSRSRSRGKSKDQDTNKDRDAGRNIAEQYSTGAQCIPSAVTVIAPAHHPENTTESWSNYYGNHSAPNSFGRNIPPKRRCRDYDERGFCVLGDLCQFDHGNDPLVVDEVSLPSMIPFPPPPPGLPPPGMLMPPTQGPTHNMRMPGPQLHPRPPPLVRIPIPRPPSSQSSLINSRDQPGTTTVPSLAPMGARLPPPLPQSLLYSVSEHTYEPDGYNPEAPSITSTGRSQYRQFFSRTPMQRPNLIGLTSGEMDTNPRAANIIIQTEPPIGIASNSSNVSRVVLEPDNRKRISNTMEGPSPKKPWIGKQTNNQNKPGFLKKSQYTNTKLEVRKIPPELNNITQLNEHFSKFGTIVNIQVAFKNDPEAALIQYLTNDEARKAISSTEAVLNNRFIRVLWHRESMHSSMPKVVKPLAAGAYVFNKVPVKHRLGTTSGNQPDSQHVLLSQSNATTEDVQLFPSSTTHTKMVYSSSNLKTGNKSGTGNKSHDVQEVLKKKQETMKLQQDMRKKQQEMLEKQIECQKMLISKLEKNKTTKPEERAEIMKTLKELTGKISQLKDELKTSSVVSTSKLKSKTEAQKELLDAELDLHKRLSSGEDTTELRKKLSQLQVEAARLGILPVGRGKAMSAQTRGRGRGHGGRGRGIVNHMVVDHRPKALTIVGFVEEEKDEVLQHFSQFGDIEGLQEEESPLSVVLTFKSRSEAENAANQGLKFKDRRLQISWHKPKLPSVSTETEEEEPKEEETETSDLFLPEDDDDEDEDEDESRSWRR